MQWDLLPPLSGHASGASIAGVVEPAYSTGGDSFDYAGDHRETSAERHRCADSRRRRRRPALA
jgi:hypothetical protein